MYGMSEMTILYLPQIPPCFLIAGLSFYNIPIVSNPVTCSIIVKLEKADAYNVARKKARDFRLSAAIELIAEQKRVSNERLITWREWCKQNLPELPPKEIRSLLHLARSDQPTPKKTPAPSRPPDMPQMIEAKKWFRHLSLEECGFFLKWVRETGLY
jgi:hypothetical protein